MSDAVLAGLLREAGWGPGEQPSKVAVRATRTEVIPHLLQEGVVLGGYGLDVPAPAVLCLARRKTSTCRGGDGDVAMATSHVLSLADRIHQVRLLVNDVLTLASTYVDETTKERLDEERKAASNALATAGALLHEFGDSEFV